MGLYAMYLKEREGKDILETEKGFITYKIFENGECYIQDIFVVPEERHTGLAFEMRDKVIELAKTKGCHTLLGSVCTDSNNYNRNLKILLNDGWQIHAINNNMIFVNKRIAGEV